MLRALGRGCGCVRGGAVRAMATSPTGERAAATPGASAVPATATATASATAATPAEAAFLAGLFGLRGRAALVTGGGTGIGAALAGGLARAGATVVLVGRRADVLEQTRDAIRRAVPRPPSEPAAAHMVPFDLLRLDDMEELVARAAALAGQRPTILVNNAGVNLRKPAADLTPEDWHRTLALTLTAPAQLARALAPGFRSAQYGRILSVASLQSYRAFPDSAPYGAAKSGLLGLTRALAEAYSAAHGYPGVTCNALAPGFVATDLTAPVFADADRASRLAAQTLAGRNSVPDDLVGATVFLASPAAAYVTGQCLPVDGGFTALGLR